MTLKYKLISVFALCTTFAFAFQNCADFGTFIADYSELASLDPHADAWRPVHGLEVKNGEWQKVEQRVEHKERGTDRNFVASVLYRAFLPVDESKWNESKNRPIRNLIDTYVHRNYFDFGGPCFYSIPERRVGNVNVGCTGTTPEQMDNPVLPGSNVFRSSLKTRLCDKLLQNNTALANFKTNAQEIAKLLDTDDLLYAAHQVFYLGSDPRKRTYASLGNLYDLATESEGGKEMEGLRHVGLALCTSVGWETP